LRNRVKYQHEYKQFVMLADAQALTDNMDDIDKVHRNVVEVALDYLAVGIDPKLSTIFIQSQVPELTELAFYYLNLVTVARLERNPTVKEEIRLRDFERDIPAGFLTYPVSQAADITAFKATLVPVGEDQIPMIEQTNEIVRRFNRTYKNASTKQEILVETKALVPELGRLPGIDGKAKMSKSLGNVINLGATADEISKAVKKVYTDPLHLKIEDPGHVEGNIAFTYLDAFDTDKAAVAELKAHYTRGGLADSIVKKRLEAVLQEMLEPIRTRRAELADDKGYILQLLREGTEQAREVAAQTMSEVRAALGLTYF
jgi:tryptophanyl-tRNA synthetase